MGQFDGKKGLILGVANDRSIAWAIAQHIMQEGGNVVSPTFRTGRTTPRGRIAVAWPSAPRSSRIERSSWCRWTCATTRTSPR